MTIVPWVIVSEQLSGRTIPPKVIAKLGYDVASMVPREDMAQAIAELRRLESRPPQQQGNEKQ